MVLYKELLFDSPWRVVFSLSIGVNAVFSLLQVRVVVLTYVR